MYMHFWKCQLLTNDRVHNMSSGPTPLPFYSLMNYFNSVYKLYDIKFHFPTKESFFVIDMLII